MTQRGGWRIGGWTVTMRPGRGLLPPSPPKCGEGDGENDRRGVEKRGRHIVLMQRKVENMGNLGRMTGYIYRATLVKSGRVHNMGSVTYENVDERGRLQITVQKKGKEENGGGGERES